LGGKRFENQLGRSSSSTGKSKRGNLYGTNADKNHKSWKGFTFEFEKAGAKAALGSGAIALLLLSKGA
jgi:hypothetical protein